MEKTQYAYVPGDWWIIAHPHGMAVLHHSFSLAKVQRLWGEISRQTPLVTWLSLLVDGELSKLGDFGMARFTNGTVELVLRGQVVATIDGTPMDAQRKLTWREETITAEKMSLIGTSNSRDALPSMGGVMFGDVLTWEKGHDKVSVLDTLNPAEILESSTFEGIQEQSASEDSGETTSILSAETIEETWTVAPGNSIDGAEAEEKDLPDFLAQGSDVLSLELPDGNRINLDHPTLVGRAPEAPIGKENEYQLVTVDSPQHDVSRTHVEIKGDGAMAVVTDQRSINGTIIIEPGLSPRRLHSGEGVSVPAGTQIDIGDGIVMSVIER